VMAAWSGLGYYRRARLLHQGVREVQQQYGGSVPTDPVARRALPGVGRYTAGAIGSIAFDQPEPIVDGNVARVLSRYLGLDAPLGSRDSARQLWLRAEQLVQGPRPGELNQAIMELGALVCTKAQPRCSVCPWQAECVAKNQSRVTELPVPRARKSPVPVELVALVAEQGRGKRRGTWLVHGSGALFGGLWSPPMQGGHGVATARALAAHHQLDGTLEDSRCARIRHVLSHRDLDIEVYRMEARARASVQRRRVSGPELSELGISALTRKILQAASE